MGFRTWYGFKRDTHTTILDSRITNQAGYVNTGGLLRPDINFSGALMFDVRYWGFCSEMKPGLLDTATVPTLRHCGKEKKNCTCCRLCFMTIVYPLSLGLLIPRFLWHQWCFLSFSPCEGFAARLSHWVKFSWVVQRTEEATFSAKFAMNDWVACLTFVSTAEEWLNGPYSFPFSSVCLTLLSAFPFWLCQSLQSISRCIACKDKCTGTAAPWTNQFVCTMKGQTGAVYHRHQ